MNEMVEPEASPSSTTEAEIDYTWPFGAKHKRSRRIIGTILLLILISPVVWICFEAEITAAIWHMRHGNSFDYGGVRFTIPRDRYVRCWAEYACSVMPGTGYLQYRLTRQPAAWIMLNASSTNSTDKIRQREKMQANVMHWKLVEERSIKMAGAGMQCLDYLQANQRFHSIMCYGAETPIYATYMGNGDTEKFYTLLTTAQKR